MVITLYYYSLLFKKLEKKIREQERLKKNPQNCFPLSHLGRTWNVPEINVNKYTKVPHFFGRKLEVAARSTLKFETSIRNSN
jgi:hypothetical protein